MTRICVTKRSGEKEPLSLDKIHRVLEWATEDLTGVSISEIEIRANIQLYDDIHAYDIHELLIKSAAELISKDTPNYQFVAARLINYKLRKEVYGDYEPPLLYHIVEKNTELNLYDPFLLETYSEEDWSKAQSFIKHERDDAFSYAGMEQFRGKYLVQDRTTGETYETPQVLYMLVAMTLFSGYPIETRMSWIKRYYDAISTFKLSLPTPILAGARTRTRQFSSCVLIESGDSLDSIFSTGTAIGKYAAKRAGIGIGGGAIRASGSKVGQGEIVHTGIIPYWRFFRGALKSCSQGGIRGASATVNFPFFHLESEDLIVLKNNKGTQETRIRDMDYCIHLNGFFLQRVIDDGYVTLFSPHEVRDMYDAFYGQDQKLFAELYEKYERSRSVRKKRVKAREYFSDILTERQETGRIYIFFADNVNLHSSFDIAIKMTNLCTEITLPTAELQYEADLDGEIALCTLSAINWGLIQKPEDFKDVCTLAVRGLDALLDYQDYPIPAAAHATYKRRPLGIGVTNFAYFLAKRGLRYDKGSLETVHEYAEAWSYYLIRASMELAKEKGETPSGFEDTKYSRGVFPIDTYKKAVDDLIKPVYKMDWAQLKLDVKKNGMANSTLMCLMPAESSAQTTNATNGFEPPPELVTKKKSKHGTLAQVVPEIQKLKNAYDLRWDQDPKNYLAVAAVMQKFMDQSGSFNTSHNPEHYGGKIPMSVLMEDVVRAYKYGLKTLYYANPSPTMVQEEHFTELPESDIIEEECEACTI